jgi:hypothetical protein
MAATHEPAPAVTGERPMKIAASIVDRVQGVRMWITLGVSFAAAEGALFQRVIDRSEHRIELRAQPVHGSNNRQGNARRDLAILDGGGAGFVSYKCANEIVIPRMYAEEVFKAESTKHQPAN